MEFSLLWNTQSIFQSVWGQKGYLTYTWMMIIEWFEKEKRQRDEWIWVLIGAVAYPWESNHVKRLDVVVLEMEENSCF